MANVIDVKRAVEATRQVTTAIEMRIRTEHSNSPPLQAPRFLLRIGYPEPNAAYVAHRGEFGNSLLATELEYRTWRRNLMRQMVKSRIKGRVSH